MVCCCVWLQKRIPNDIIFKKIGLHSQKMINILSSVIYIVRDLYEHLKITSNSTLILSRIFIRTSKITRKVAMASIWSCQLFHTNRVFYILQEKQASLKRYLFKTRLRQMVLKPTLHPKATPINASQSPTLYYLEPFHVEKECIGPLSDKFRCHK